MKRSVTGLDTSVTVRFAGDQRDAVIEAFLRAWSRCLDRPAETRGESVTLALGTNDGHGGSRRQRRVASDNLGDLMQLATQRITNSLISARAGQFLMFHAGAVCHPRTGRSLVFVARGGTGKTTLARTLGATFGYLTDETVAIDSEGIIRPYPKPLSIRVPGQSHKDELSPDELGLEQAHDRPFVDRVVLLRRSSGHDAAPEVRQLSLLDAIVALAPETSSLSKLDRGLHWCADLIERTGPVVEWTYSEAEHLVPLASEILEGAP